MTLTPADLASISAIFTVISGGTFFVVRLMIDKAILNCQLRHQMHEFGGKNVRPDNGD